MIQRLIFLSVLPFLFLLIPLQLYSWGFWAHAHINQLAIFCLPPEMLSFYKPSFDWIGVHATDADKRRYAIKAEGPRHYIDLDRYPPDIPKRWAEAVACYSKDSLLEHGILPWEIISRYYALVEAFKAKDQKRILKISSDLGHYIADAHVPLHTTQNYNGQLTGQKGIHGFWESRLPELYAGDYDLLTGPAKYLENAEERAWNCVYQSTVAVDSVLTFEALLNASFEPDRKYAFEQRGEQTVRVYSRKYSAAYHRVLNGMVERRMRAAIHLVSSFWFTAWVNAGQPELNFGNIKDQEIKNEEKQKRLKNLGGRVRLHGQ